LAQESCIFANLIMAGSMEGHWAQSEAVELDSTDVFIPYTKKSQADMLTVSTAAPSSFAQEADELVLPTDARLVGANSAGVAFPSPFEPCPAPGVRAIAPPQDECIGASSAGVAFPSPFAAPVSQPASLLVSKGHWAQSEAVVLETESRRSKAVAPSDAACLASSSAGVAFPSPFAKASRTEPKSVVPVQGGLAGSAGAGVNFPSPFKLASAPSARVPFSSVQGPCLAACSSAGISFPYTKKSALDAPTVSTAPSSFVQEAVVTDARLVGASGSGVAFPSPIESSPARQAAALRLDANNFPSPFAAPESRSKVAIPLDANAFPSPFGSVSRAERKAVPLQGVPFPSPFEAPSAPNVRVPFSSVHGPSLSGCSSAGISFPSPPLVTA